MTESTLSRYTPQSWSNGFAGGTPISAARLSVMETGIYQSAKAYERLTVYNPLDFAAEASIDIDATAAIQAAIDEAAAARSGIVFLPARLWKISQLKMKIGVSLVGASMAPVSNVGTVLEAQNGTNLSAIINDPTELPATEYWHWASIRDMCLAKATSSTDTLGCGIEVNCRSGEGLIFKRLYIGGSTRGFPESGIRLNRGGAPLHLEQIYGYYNGQYLVDVKRTGADEWLSCHLNHISGDGNATALIRINTAGATAEQFVLENIKAESTAGGKQPDVIVLDGMGGKTVILRNVSSANSGSTTNSVVKIMTTSVRLLLEGIATEGTYFIDDVFGGRTIAAIAQGMTFATYHTSASRYNALNETNGLTLGSGTPLRSYYSGTGTPSLGTIGAGAVVTFNITATGALAADMCTVSPAAANPGTGLVWSGYVASSNTVEVRVANPTAAPIITSDVLWRASVWKH